MKNDRNDYFALLILTRVYPYQACPFNFRILFYFNYELVLFSIIRWQQDAPVYSKLISQLVLLYSSTYELRVCSKASGGQS